MLFKDRKDAGCQLATALKKLSLKNAIVIALPRGGVVVAAEVAKALHLPLDVIIPRKIGAPFNSELAIGALVGDVVLLNDALIANANIDPTYIEETIAKEKREASRRLALYRAEKKPLVLKDRIVVIVDDGIATGATMRASIRYLQSLRVKRLIIAVPVASQEIVQSFKDASIEMICLFSPETFYAVGQFYEDFQETHDNEVIQLLESFNGNKNSSQ